ncbi:Membrane glycoprotein [Variovorax sp. WDL1]|nr:Membrane glycoprotein [Variovorax sp. WDL1]
MAGATQGERAPFHHEDRTAHAGTASAGASDAPSESDSSPAPAEAPEACHDLAAAAATTAKASRSPKEISTPTTASKSAAPALGATKGAAATAATAQATASTSGGHAKFSKAGPPTTGIGAAIASISATACTASRPSTVAAYECRQGRSAICKQATAPAAIRRACRDGRASIASHPAPAAHATGKRAEFATATPHRTVVEDDHVLQVGPRAIGHEHRAACAHAATAGGEARPTLPAQGPQVLHPQVADGRRAGANEEPTIRTGAIQGMAIAVDRRICAEHAYVARERDAGRERDGAVRGSVCNAAGQRRGVARIAGEG